MSLARIASAGDDIVVTDARMDGHDSFVALALATSLDRLLKTSDASALNDLARAHARRKSAFLGSVDPEADRLAEGLLLGALELAKAKVTLEPKELEGWAPALPREDLAGAVEKLRAHGATSPK